MKYYYEALTLLQLNKSSVGKMCECLGIPHTTMRQSAGRRAINNAYLMQYVFDLDRLLKYKSLMSKENKIEYRTACIAVHLKTLSNGREDLHNQA